MKSLFTEDNVMRDSERQVTGIGKSSDVQANTVGHLARNNKINQTTADTSHDNSDNSLAPTILPYPMGQLDEILSDLYIATVNVKKIIENTRCNPSLNRRYIPILDEVERKIVSINDISVEISNLVDKMKM